ncbi:MAG: TolC family protein [Tidjanibacter sp.]|nr:TolC family protein [Tidjanibacter sp.]
MKRLSLAVVATVAAPLMGISILGAQTATTVDSQIGQSPAESTTVTVLTLDNALQIALSESPTIRIADAEIEVQNWAKKGTYAQLFPQINASGSYQRNLKKQKMYMSIGGQVQGIEVGMNNSYNAGVNLQVPVVSVELWKSLEISALNVELAVEKSRSSRLDMVEQVTKAFYQVLLAKESLSVYEAVYANSLDNYNQVQNKYNVGKASEYEYSSAIVSVKNAEPNVFQAENAVYLTLWQLKALLGVDLSMEIDCAGTLADFEPLLTDIDPRSLSTEGNSSIKQLDLQLEQLTANLKIQQASYYPSLALTGTLTVMTMDDSFDFNKYMWSPYSYAGLSLSIPIFDGGKRRSNVRSTQLGVDKLQLQKANAQRNLQVQLMQYVNNMRTDIKKFNAAQTTVEEAEKSYRLAQRRFEIGGGTLLEVNNALLQLTQSRLTLNQSVYDYLSSKASLENIVGKEYYGEVPQSTDSQK